MNTVAIFPAAEDTMTPPRANDATKLTLTLPVAIGVAIFMVSLVGSVWGGGYILSKQIDAQSSDIRDMRTRMDNADKNKELERQNLDLRLDLMKAEIEQSELRKALLERMKPPR